MFEKIKSTKYPPKDKPLMVWDGDCGFCKYWIIRWKMMTDDRIDYEPYQEVSENFKDIKVKHFKEAVRLIEPSGKVFNGPEAAYRAYQYGGKDTDPVQESLLPLYRKFALFRKISDYGYYLIAENRSFMMKLTKRAFGKNPRSLKPYWAFYALGFLLLVKLFKRD